MTQIDVTQVFRTLDGEPVKDGDDVVLTLRGALVTALLSQLPDEKADAMLKVKCFKLAQRIHDEDEVGLSAEDVVLCKDRIGTVYTALIVGQAYEWLDPVES